ncbi:hypothetical protein [Streptomyces sp. PU-14G]|uniref:hypothetical protein n=1 Tax=Streptomyces sp. PU-14G TaxID=2800808 RepID=UPI0034E012C0
MGSSRAARIAALVLPKTAARGAVLFERAADHRDEHVIKFADTAVDSFERSGNPEALAAAHVAADLIDAAR